MISAVWYAAVYGTEEWEAQLSHRGAAGAAEKIDSGPLVLKGSRVLEHTCVMGHQST